MSPNDALGQVRDFLARVSLGATPVFMRRSVYGGIAEPTRLSTYAWLSRVVLRGREEKRQGVRFTTSAFLPWFPKEARR